MSLIQPNHKEKKKEHNCLATSKGHYTCFVSHTAGQFVSGPKIKVQKHVDAVYLKQNPNYEIS